MKYKSFTDTSSKHRISSLDLYNLSFHYFSCIWVLYSHLKITNYISISFIYFRATKLDLPRTSSSISSSVGFCPILRITPTSSCRNCRLFSTQMSPFPLIKSRLWYSVTMTRYLCLCMYICIVMLSNSFLSWDCSAAILIQKVVFIYNNQAMTLKLHSLSIL